MTEKEKRRSRGRPEGTRKVSAPGEPYGGRELKLRLHPEEFTWVHEQGAQEWLLWLVRAMKDGGFAGSLDVVDGFHLDLPGRVAYLMDENEGRPLSAARARSVGAWLLTYAKEAEAWEERK